MDIIRNGNLIATVSYGRKWVTIRFYDVIAAARNGVYKTMTKKILIADFEEKGIR